MSKPNMLKTEKRLYIRTFGCQMNNRDSEFIIGLLMEKGFNKAASIDEADVVLFNTCSVRKHAEDRSISNMGALLKRKAQSEKRKDHPPSQYQATHRRLASADARRRLSTLKSPIHEGGQNSKIFGIIGCTAQALKQDLYKRLPGLDIVCGTGEIYRLPWLIEQASKSKVLACDNIDRDIPEVKANYRENKKATFVSIMRGCNNFCSYCIVPYVRGRERSRRVDDIIKEVEDLAKRGIKEITLLGQNVNSYRNNECNFVKLLKTIDGIDGIEKIKFMTSHPKDATVELFKAIKDLDKVAKELHLPMQSGSDRILKLMNRGYTVGKYIGLIRDLRRLIPDCKVTTDIIIGFPAESERDFEKTYNLMNDIKFNAAYIFKYSPRPPAKSALLEDNVPKEVKEKRHRILLDLQKSISKKKK